MHNVFMNQPLTSEQREIMIEAHQAERNKRQADRIKTILLLDEGRPYSEITKILLLDDTTIRRYEKEYQTYPLHLSFPRIRQPAEGI